MTDETKTQVLNPYPVDSAIKAPDGTPLHQIHRAMFAAKLDMPAVARDGRLELGSNSVPFTKIDDIRSALYPILAKHGIMVYLSYGEGTDELQVAEEPLTMAGFSDELRPDGTKTGAKVLNPSREIRDGKIPTTRYWATVIYNINFVFVGDNSGVVVRVKGMAYDTNSDKAVGKATTAAVKRAFTETFDIIDGKEEDENLTDEDEKNRAATTDRREGGDRGSQQRAAAQGGGSGTAGTRRSGPQRSISTDPTPGHKRDAEAAAEETGADTTTGELPEPQAPPAPSKLDLEKARVRNLNDILKMPPAEINALATQLTGKATRDEWIVLPTAVKKVADALQERVDAKAADQ